jgi:hypothetical protein
MPHPIGKLLRDALGKFMHTPVEEIRPVNGHLIKFVDGVPVEPIPADPPSDSLSVSPSPSIEPSPSVSWSFSESDSPSPSISPSPSPSPSDEDNVVWTPPTIEVSLAPGVSRRQRGNKKVPAKKSEDQLRWEEAQERKKDPNAPKRTVTFD